MRGLNLAIKWVKPNKGEPGSSSGPKTEEDVDLKKSDMRWQTGNRKSEETEKSQDVTIQLNAPETAERRKTEESGLVH